MQRPEPIPKFPRRLFGFHLPPGLFGFDPAGVGAYIAGQLRAMASAKESADAQLQIAEARQNQLEQQLATAQARLDEAQQEVTRLTAELGRFVGIERTLERVLVRAQEDAERLNEEARRELERARLEGQRRLSALEDEIDSRKIEAELALRETDRSYRRSLVAVRELVGDLTEFLQRAQARHPSLAPGAAPPTVAAPTPPTSPTPSVEEPQPAPPTPAAEAGPAPVAEAEVEAEPAPPATAEAGAEPAPPATEAEARPAPSAAAEVEAGPAFPVAAQVDEGLERAAPPAAGEPSPLASDEFAQLMAALTSSGRFNIVEDAAAAEAQPAALGSAQPSPAAAGEGPAAAGPLVALQLFRPMEVDELGWWVDFEQAVRALPGVGSASVQLRTHDSAILRVQTDQPDILQSYLATVPELQVQS